MTRKFFDCKTIVIYVLIITLFLTVGLIGNHSLSAFSTELKPSRTVVIDAGHGGVDCGAVSCTGIYESSINLEIALKLNDLMHLLGIRTVMIRDTDRSVYTQGETIAAKKVSDIKERIRITNTTPNGLLISIHQNYFPDSRYSGVQVFYNSQHGSKELAAQLQSEFRTVLSPNNKRQIKKASDIYLMDHIQCEGILVECGFLSNPEEEAMLRRNVYQQKLSAVIAAKVSQYLNT